MIYFKSGKCTVENSTSSDVYFISENMRDADRNEIWAASHESPFQSLSNGLINSDPCFTAKADGIPFAMFGVNRFSKGLGVIWLLGTESVKTNYRNFLKLSIVALEYLLDEYPRMFNFVDARHKESIRWLEWLGARICKPEPFGEDQLPFHYFEFRRGDIHV